MPSVVVLKDCLGKSKILYKDLYFLIKEEDFPIEAVQLIQDQVKQFTQTNDEYTRDDLVALAEDIIERYKGTLIPFKLYLVSY
jgi:hypothetical protein